MATHSSILAWRIPWPEEPGGLQSTGSQRVRHNRSDWAHSTHGLGVSRPQAKLGRIWEAEMKYQSLSPEVIILLLLLFCRSLVSDSLRPRELQRAGLPCPPLFPRVCPNSCPLSQWCHLTISSSVVPFSSCPQSFPASGSFPMSQLFASGGQSVGASGSVELVTDRRRGADRFQFVLTLPYAGLNFP